MYEIILKLGQVKLYTNKKLCDLVKLVKQIWESFNFINIEERERQALLIDKKFEYSYTTCFYIFTIADLNKTVQLDLLHLYYHIAINTIFCK